MITKEMARVIDDIRAERIRQVDKEGWSPERDDAEHFDGSLAAAAACYANPISVEIKVGRFVPSLVASPVGWPASWNAKWYKPTGRRRDLIKAGALIVAEIERMDRAEAKRKDDLARIAELESRHRFRRQANRKG